MILSISRLVGGTTFLFLVGCLYWAVAVKTTEDPTKVAIIRQVNKVNDDGSYTFGYEAADGTFKIETRDVLGNVKGMFGYIDESGDLKRVSYTARNDTGFQSTTVENTLKLSDSTDKIPVLIMRNTRPEFLSSTRSPVIQHIPKNEPDEEDEKIELPSKISEPKSSTDVNSDEVSNTNEGAHRMRKVIVSKRPLVPNEKGPLTREKEPVTRGKGGNAIRRQLPGDGGPYVLRYTSDYPPPFGNLMSELKPVQASEPFTEDIRESDSQTVEYVAQLPVTTTTSETPYGMKQRQQVEHGSIRNYLFTPSTLEEQYPVTDHYNTDVYQERIEDPYKMNYYPAVDPYKSPYPYQSRNSPPVPYTQNPGSLYYPPFSYVTPQSVRDELSNLVFNYLNIRLHQLAANYIQNPYYSRNPYGIQINPYPNPYPNPYYPIPKIPIQQNGNPNVQLSPRKFAQRRRTQTVRSTDEASEDTDLLQMLLTSPTKMPYGSSYGSSKSTEIPSTQKITQPVRNVQIVTEETTGSTRPVTESTE